MVRAGQARGQFTGSVCGATDRGRLICREGVCRAEQCGKAQYRPARH
jgi:hypothetical protein